jgi:hypothetical protein
MHNRQRDADGQSGESGEPTRLVAMSTALTKM